VVGLVGGLLIAQLSLLNGVLFVTLAFTALGSLFLEPLLGIIVALFLGPLWAWLRAEFPEIPPLIGQYVFLMAVATWVARGLVRRELHIPLPPGLLLLLGFMGIALVSLWDPADAWVGAWEWFKWGQILVMFLIVYDRLQGPKGVRRVVLLGAGLVGVAVFQAGMGLWQCALRGTGPDHFAIGARFYRAYGTFEQPNPYGGFLGIIAALLMGVVLNAGIQLLGKVSDQNHGLLVLGKVSGRSSGLNALGKVSDRNPSSQRYGLQIIAVVLPLLLVTAALIASWSRGAWLGFGAACLVMVAALPRRGLWGAVLVILLVGLGLGLYHTDLLPASIASRMTDFLAYTRFEDVRGVGINDANYAVLERMAHWQAALEMWRARFWLGVGFGCYEPAYPAYRLLNWPIALGHAHNYYLNLLAETGCLGLAAYLVFFAGLFWRLWSVTRWLSGWPRGLGLGLIGAWTHLCVHNLVDNLWVNNVHLHLGTLLALGAWLLAASVGDVAQRSEIGSRTASQKCLAR
jgi:O-antigen ligase